MIRIEFILLKRKSDRLEKILTLLLIIRRWRKQQKEETFGCTTPSRVLKPTDITLFLPITINMALEREITLRVQPSRKVKRKIVWRAAGFFYLSGGCIAAARRRLSVMAFQRRQQLPRQARWSRLSFLNSYEISRVMQSSAAFSSTEEFFSCAWTRLTETSFLRSMSRWIDPTYPTSDIRPGWFDRSNTDSH